MPKLASLRPQKSRIVDYSHLNIYDPEFDSNSDDSSDAAAEDNTENCTDGGNSMEGDEEYLWDHLFNISSITFSDTRVFDLIHLTLAKSYPCDMNRRKTVG